MTAFREIGKICNFFPLIIRLRFFENIRNRRNYQISVER